MRPLGNRRRGLGTNLAWSDSSFVGITWTTATRALSTTATIATATTVVVIIILAAVLDVVVLATWLTITIVLVRPRLLGLTRVGDRAWDVFRRVVDVEFLINVLGDGLDFGAQFLLNLVQIESVLPVDEIDSEAKVTKAAGTTDTVQICLSVLWKVKVDYDIDRLNIDTTSE